VKVIDFADAAYLNKYISLSDVAVDSTTGIVLFLYEWGSDIVIAKVSKNASGVISLDDYVYIDGYANGLSYSGGDPHAIAVYTDSNSETIGVIPAASGYSATTKDGKTYLVNLSKLLLDKTTYTREANGHTLTAAAIAAATGNSNIKTLTYKKIAKR
jgi:hypothetical protein